LRALECGDLSPLFGGCASGQSGDESPHSKSPALQPRQRLFSRGLLQRARPYLIVVTPMHFLDLTLSSLPENLALDEALLLQAEAGLSGEALRIWESPQPVVVLGAACRLSQDVDEASSRADGVPILRRSSGGGTVLLGPGCLLYSLVLAYDRAPALREILSSYRCILERIRDALRDAVPGIEIAGTSDLAVAGRKFSGNSQQRKRGHLLHHGSLLYDFALGTVGHYLRQPARQPEYRADRPHETFLMNLPLGAEEIKRRLRAAWNADAVMTTWPKEKGQELTAEKYERPEWTHRR
jgi:lipoate---protein ligase